MLNKEEENFDFDEYLEEESADFSSGIHESDFESEKIGSGKDRVIGVYEKIFNLFFSILVFWLITMRIEINSWDRFFVLILIVLITKIISGFVTFMIFSIFIRKRVTGMFSSGKFSTGFDFINFFIYYSTSILLTTFFFLVIAAFVPGLNVLFFFVSSLVSTLICSTITTYLQKKNIFIALFALFIGILVASTMFFLFASEILGF